MTMSNISQQERLSFSLLYFRSVTRMNKSAQQGGAISNEAAAFHVSPDGLFQVLALSRVLATFPVAGAPGGFFHWFCISGMGSAIGVASALSTGLPHESP
jgi:hypothetical protein